MELFQIQCFVAVAEELHFGRAAARLFMTQPPLSRQIQMLEEEIGTRLIERTSRNVHLTAAGRVFLQDAITLLTISGQAVANARRTASGEAGQITVGYTAVSGYALIPNLIAAAQKRYPDIDIVLQEMVSPEQFDALAHGKIDLAFVRPVGSEEGLSLELVVSEPMLLAIPAVHPLAHKPRILPKDLSGQPFIMYAAKEGKYFHERITGLFALSGIRPNYVQHIGQTHTILGLIEAGIGIGIVPASARQLRFENIVYRPLWSKQMVAEMYIAWSSRHHNPALDLIRHFAIEHCAALRIGAVSRRVAKR